jgi:hypothetical protein
LEWGLQHPQLQLEHSSQDLRVPHSPHPPPRAWPRGGIMENPSKDKNTNRQSPVSTLYLSDHCSAEPGFSV